MIYSHSHDNKSLSHIKRWIAAWQELPVAAIQVQVRELQHLVLNEGMSLANILPQSFALTILAIKHALNLSVYDVQILGAIALWENKVIEMQTGEGKTLVATLPAALHALKKLGVHVITVNDYLVFRDATEMGKVYDILGLSVAYVVNESESEERQKAYLCDITYVTSNEAGFDYLRDNLTLLPEQQVHRTLHTAIIEEVDSNILDEANITLDISDESLYRGGRGTGPGPR
jgi:preprotein translocase subunit SecA